MGTGKTVTMSFVISELAKRNKYRIPRPGLYYCYCHDGQAGQALYVVSVLTLALLDHVRMLRKVFYIWVNEEEDAGRPNPGADLRRLGQWLQDMISKLERPMHIIIDGFDECDETSRKYLANLFDHLTRSNPRLKTLVASRPTSRAHLGAATRIQMPSNSSRDRLIVEFGIKNWLDHLPENVQKLIADEMSEKAEGSAIWVSV